MKNFSAKTPTMRVFCTMDFAPDLADGATISSTNDTEATVFYGVDADPAAVIDGSPILSGTIVGQWVIGGLEGVQYAISFSVNCSNGEVLVGQGLQSVKRYI